MFTLMKTWRVLTFLILAPASTVSEPLSKQIVSYRIEARLALDGSRRPADIDGRMQLSWLNDSRESIPDLQFHLYLNAFRNERSTFFRESGGQLRGDRFAPGEWGWINITEMKLAGGEDLTSRIEFIHPDDDNADDQTVIRVGLPRAVRPGERVALEIAFQAHLPRVFARTGYWNSFAMVAQWFPKLGVWESAGERRRREPGWNTHQFHATSEFYADFGVYDVYLTVPAAYRDRIGATGEMRAVRENPDGTLTYNYYQEDVHDFAWTVDTRYRKVVRTFKPDEWVSADEVRQWAQRFNLPEDQVRLREVEVTLLVQPEHAGQIDRHFRAAFNAIKYFGLWYGPYPYRTLTVVDPPHNGEGAGGMEYPTLITAGTRWWPGRDQNPEEVIVHEFGHQYWYGMVATNEFEESWLDEGFNTYSTSKAMKAAYGANTLPFSLFGVTWGHLPIDLPRPFENRALTLRGPLTDPIVRPAWEYFDQTSYALNSYPRTALTLGTLERYLGEDAFARVMRVYFTKWRFNHPTSEDFFDHASEASGTDLSWFFNQFVLGTSTLDYEVESLEIMTPQQRAGIYERDGRRVELKGKDAPTDENLPYDTEVVVRRNGEAWFPVELLVQLENGGRVSGRPVTLQDGVLTYEFESSSGERWIDTWPIDERWKKFRLRHDGRAISAEVDPDGKLLLDANWVNNSRRPGATGAGGALRWSSGILFWTQTLLEALSFFT
jgi:hypothetical protein